jgi:2-keto-4-pentenoate hydratase
MGPIRPIHRVRPIRWRAGAAVAAAAAVALVGCATRVADAPTCPSDAEIAAKVQRFNARAMEPTPPAGLTMEGAACGQRKFAAALVPTLGPVVGWKAGLTTAAMQQRFGIGAPLKGTLLKGMLLQEGATVPAAFGARPFAEADLLVEVGSSANHDAKTPAEVLPHLRAVIPFIELADTTVADPSKINAATLVLINVGARMGVMGRPIPVQGHPGLADALRDMTVKLSDDTGATIGSNKGSAILGHPLAAAVWLAGELKKEGVTLKPGDLLSLGTFVPGPATAGRTLTVTYEGLPGTPSVRVTFR